MKRNFLNQLIIAFSLLLFSNNLKAQESTEYLKIRDKLNYRDGFIIEKDSTKINGLIRDDLMNESSLYSGVEFVYKDGSKKRFKPADIKGFGTIFHNYISDGESFYKIISTGDKVNLYFKLTQRASSSYGGDGGTTYMTTSKENFYTCKTIETEIKLVRKKNFIEEFSNYFSDCEKLKVKIISKKVTHKDIKSIVDEYNNCK